MKSAFPFILTVFIFIQDFPAIAQQVSFLTKATYEAPDRRLEAKYQANLKKVGFQIDKIALDSGRVILAFDNIRALSKIFRKDSDGLRLTLNDATTIQLTKDEIETQLLNQILNQDAKRIRLKKLLRGMPD